MIAEVTERLARAMGGDPVVENRPDGGARSTVRLPLEQDGLEHAGSRETATGGTLTTVPSNEARSSIDV